MTDDRDSTLIRSYRSLALESPVRSRDALLRALDVSLAAFFLLLLAPVSAAIAVAMLLTSGRPLLYRGERVGRGGGIFEMVKFRTLKRGAEERLGPYLGDELVRRTKAETTPIGGWVRGGAHRGNPPPPNGLPRGKRPLGP